MSRIGRKPIAVPPQVKVELKDGLIHVEGPKGKLDFRYNPRLQVAFDAGARQVTVSRASDERLDRSLHGLTRSLISNMIKGVVDGYERRLEIHGVGYQVRVQGKNLLLDVGFSGRKSGGRPAEFVIEIPAGLTVKVDQPTNPGKLSVSGVDKQLVGQFASEIRAIRPPDPYQAKGIRYEGEHIHRKQGKAAVGTGTQ
jgi:large subunit ribosomal protein L6